MVTNPKDAAKFPAANAYNPVCISNPEIRKRTLPYKSYGWKRL